MNLVTRKQKKLVTLKISEILVTLKIISHTKIKIGMIKMVLDSLK